MLRILVRTTAQLWKDRPRDAHALHLHHIDPGNELIRQEFLTRLGQNAYAPAIRFDIASHDAHRKALAEQIDEEHYRGMPPYAAYAARTIFMHTLAFNDQLKGVPAEGLRYSILGPSTDISFIEDARKRFVAESAYLDDRPNVPLRFLAEANLTQIIRRQEQAVDPAEARAELNARIREIFGGSTFNLAAFPAGAYDVPDDAGDGKPYLAVIGYDATAVGGTVEQAPELVRRIFQHKGADESGTRINRNNVVFVVADEARKDEMRQKMVRRIALRELRRPERLAELAEHQQQKVKELESRSAQEVAVAIQQCYRHVFYPARGALDGVDLAHTAIEIQSAAADPGSGQMQVLRALRDNRKLRTQDDHPDSPAYIRDRTPLRKGQITTLALRDEFRRDPGLPILLGDDIFIRAIRNGVESGEYVYRRNDLLYGPGDPAASILIDEQAVVFTMAYAREHGIWPRPAAPKPKPGEKETQEGDDDVPQPPPGPPQPPEPEPLPDGITAEGVLREALTRVWEQARGRKIERIGTLRIRMFQATDAFALLGALGSAAPRARKQVRLRGSYETKEGGALELEFSGPVSDALPVKDFLDPQVRSAAAHDVRADFDIVFDEGLPLAGDAAEKLTERLARFATGAAHVTATEAGKVPA